MSTKAWAWRAAMMTVAALLLPACKGTTSSVLFLEQFNGPFPGANWNTPAPAGSATAVKDVLNGVGTPPSSLRMTASSQPSAVTTETITSFNNPSVSFSVHMAADTASAGDAGIGTITVRDNLSAAVASASWDEATNNLTLSIAGAPDLLIASPASDLAFHRLIFSVSSGGTATWRLDNAAPLITRAGFPAGLLTVELGASFPGGTSWASFYFDNVHVTSP